MSTPPTLQSEYYDIFTFTLVHYERKCIAFDFKKSNGKNSKIVIRKLAGVKS